MLLVKENVQNRQLYSCVALTCPVAGSQIMAEAFFPSCPVATKRPHGETAKLDTRPQWPANRTCECEAFRRKTKSNGPMNGRLC